MGNANYDLEDQMTISSQPEQSPKTAHHGPASPKLTPGLHGSLILDAVKDLTSWLTKYGKSSDSRIQSMRAEVQQVLEAFCKANSETIDRIKEHRSELQKQASADLKAAREAQRANC